MRLAASCMQTLHALAPVACKAASVLQASLQEQLFELKMKTPLKNLRIYTTHVLAKAYPLTLCMARSNLERQFFGAHESIPPA
jgi:hypothetical protein